MLYWLDYRTIQVTDRTGKIKHKLLDIAIRSEGEQGKGFSYYACNRDCSIREIKRNSNQINLDDLPDRPEVVDWQHGSPRAREEAGLWKPLDLIALELLTILKGRELSWASDIYSEGNTCSKRFQRWTDRFFYGESNFKRRYADNAMFCILWNSKVDNEIWISSYREKGKVFNLLFGSNELSDQMREAIQSIEGVAYNLGIPLERLPGWQSAQAHLLSNTMDLKRQHCFLMERCSKREGDNPSQFSDLFDDVTIGLE